MTETISKRTSLSAVLFLENLPMLAPLVASWVQHGHKIAAIVMADRPNAGMEWHVERLQGLMAPQWSFPIQVHRHAPGVPIIRLAAPIKWDRLRKRLAKLDADVLISAFFPRRIPETVFSLFRCGGVNLHPALLPHFRGPSPLLHLLLRDAWREYGGVTLHRMSPGLDEGAIIATAKMGEDEHWLDHPTLHRALAGAMANLVGNAVPAYCRGEVVAVPQMEGDFGWANDDVDVMVERDWTAERFRRLLLFYGDFPGVYLPVNEERVRLGAVMKVVGPPTGEPVRERCGTVEFDLRDARVACSGMSLRTWWALVRREWREQRSSFPPAIPFSYAMQVQAEPPTF